MEENKLLAMTGLIFGTFAIALFLFPFVLYRVKHREIKDEGIIKIVGETVFIHVIFMIALVMVAAIVDVAVVKPEFKPSNGVKWFFGMMNGAGQPMWGYWLGKAMYEGNGMARDADLMKSFLVVMKYYSLIIYFACIAIPLGVLWNTVSSITEPKHGADAYYQAYFRRIQSGALTFLGSTFLVLTHTSIASLFVQMYGSPNFTFFKLINSAWHQVLFG